MDAMPRSSHAVPAVCMNSGVAEGFASGRKIPISTCEPPYPSSGTAPASLSNGPKPGQEDGATFGATARRIRRRPSIRVGSIDANRKGGIMAASRASFLIVTALLLAASSAHAGNILPNPSFDSGLDGWTLTNADAISHSSDGATSAGSVQIFSDDAIGAALNTCVPVTANEFYDIQVSVKVATEGDAFAKVGIQVFWKADTECKVEIGGLQPSALSGSAPDWQRLAVASTVP